MDMCRRWTRSAWIQSNALSGPWDSRCREARSQSTMEMATQTNRKLQKHLITPKPDLQQQTLWFRRALPAAARRGVVISLHHHQAKDVRAVRTRIQTESANSVLATVPRPAGDERRDHSAVGVRAEARPQHEPSLQSRGRWAWGPGLRRPPWRACLCFPPPPTALPALRAAEWTAVALRGRTEPGKR